MHRPDFLPTAPDVARHAGTVATGLGIFSIGLGLAEVLLPRAVGRAVGLRADQPLLVRLLGLREIAAGVGLLTGRRQAPSMWTRVVGDAVDAATLELHGAGAGPAGRRNRVAMAAAAAISVADLATAAALSAAPADSGERRPDYSHRSGFPSDPAQMRGQARRDFETPRDMRAALRTPADAEAATV